jgi:hypothetical protein
MKFNYISKLKIHHKTIYHSCKRRSVDLNLLKVKKLAKLIESDIKMTFGCAG